MKDDSLIYHKPVIKLHQPDDSDKFQPLPNPSGKYPYHLNLENVLPGINEDELVFHVVGDTGSVRDRGFQQLVIKAMIAQYHMGKPAEQPHFLYHLGDLVYNHGEAESYDAQFFTPFADYPGPIIAIAGNHDSDVNHAAPVPYRSLDAFTSVFCDTASRPVAFSNGAKRQSLTQPNVYWTLNTPLASFIGLHSNVPKYGVITPEQRAWLLGELRAANLLRPGKALIICLHHSPYSADTNHGSSLPMIDLLEGAFEETGVYPDIVFSGHVHNYQRFSKKYANGKTIPFIVAGAGGFDELHSIAHTDDTRFTDDNALFESVQLEAYVDGQYGFLKIRLKRDDTGVVLRGEYYTLPPGKDTAASLFDQFVVQI